MTSLRCIAASVCLSVIAASTPACSQEPPIGAELRVDALIATHTALAGGVGIAVPAGVYVRTSLTAASGLTWRNGSEASESRVELLSRFLLDPFRESEYGLSLGGGVGITNAADGSRWRPYVAFVMDLELTQRNGWVPAIQVGLGGGARLGVIMRSGTTRWR